MPIKIMNVVTILLLFIRHTMERKTKKKKLSGWDRKKMQETSKCEQESSKCRKLDGYLSFSTSMDIRCTRGGSIRRFAIYL